MAQPTRRADEGLRASPLGRRCGPLARSPQAAHAERLWGAAGAHVPEEPRFVRMRLAGPALYHITDGRLPYSRQPLCPGPGRLRGGRSAPVAGPGGGRARPFPARDVSRVLVYARNLVASSELSERPSLWELFTAASGGTRRSLTPRRLVRLAVQEEISDRARDLPALTYEGPDGGEGSDCGDRRWTACPGRHG